MLAFLSGLIKNTIILFSIVIIHELGHFLICKYLGYSIKKIEIYPFGGITTINKNINTKISNDILISLGGILIQVLLIPLLINLLNFNIISYKLYLKLSYYNYLIMIFNLIPIIPLDGYFVLRYLLEYIFSYRTSFIISIVIGIISLLGFIYYNIINMLDNYVIISFLIYKLINEMKNYKYIYNKFLLERYLNNYKFKRIKIISKNYLNMYKEKYHYFIIGSNYVNEKSILQKLFDKPH